MDTITSRQEHRNGAGAAVRRSLGGLGRTSRWQVGMVQNGQIQNASEGPESGGCGWMGVGCEGNKEMKAGSAVQGPSCR